MYSLSALFLFAQGTSVTVSWWVAPLITLLGTLATVTVAWVSLTRTIRSEKEAQWRAERKQAYVDFLALARAAKAATDQPPSKGTTEEKKAKILEDLRDAHATVVLVGKTDDFLAAAQAYYEICKYKLQDEDLSKLEINDYKKARDSFFVHARDELGLPPYIRL